jgi:uncharacterized protein (DUF3820 family)
MADPPSDAFDHQALIELASARMPFGKYQGRRLVDLPEAYLVWFSRQGFPGGKLGDQMRSALAIKENGLEDLVRRVATLTDG